MNESLAPSASALEPAATIALPEELQGMAARGKDMGIIFRGRKPELRKLWNGVRETDGRVDVGGMQATVISAAPGAGKSTLVEKWGQELEASNVLFANMSPNMFTSAEDFHAGLRLIEPWASVHRAGQKKKAGRKYLGKILDSALRTLLNAPLSLVGMSTEAVDLIETIAEGVAQERMDDPRQVLQAMSLLQPAGAVIAVDEAQGWIDQIGNRFLEDMLATMTNRKYRERLGIKRIGLLVAGLGDTPEVLEALKVTRPREIDIGALEVEATAEIIDARIDLAGCPTDISAQLKQNWTPPLAERFCVWGHHANAAGIAAQRVAQWNPTHPHAYDYVVALALDDTAELYNQTLQRVNNLRSEVLLSMLVAKLRQQDGTLGPEELDKIIAVAQRLADADSHFRALPREDVRRHLLHGGLLQKQRGRQADDRTRSTGSALRYEVPIPSLLNYAIRTVGEDQLQVAEATLNEKPTEHTAPDHSKIPAATTVHHRSWWDRIFGRKAGSSDSTD